MRQCEKTLKVSKCDNPKIYMTCPKNKFFKLKEIFLEQSTLKSKFGSTMLEETPELASNYLVCKQYYKIINM